MIEVPSWIKGWNKDNMYSLVFLCVCVFVLPERYIMFSAFVWAGRVSIMTSGWRTNADPRSYKSGWWFQICLYFHPYLGKIPILTNIFQRCWNHQLEIYVYFSRQCSLKPQVHIRYMDDTDDGHAPVSWLVNLPPPNVPPPRNKALLRAY